LDLERQILREGVLPWIDRQIQDLGDIFQFRVGTNQLVILAHPDHARHVLINAHQNYARGFGYEVIGILLGQGLLTSDDQLWRSQRRICQPSFSRPSVESLIPTMVQESQALSLRWDEKKERGVPDIDMVEEMLRVTMRVVGACLFGQDVDEFCTQLGPDLARAQRWAVEYFINPVHLPLWVPTPRHVAFKRVARRVDRVIERFVVAGRDGVQAKGGLLSALQHATDSDTGYRMSEKQLRDECLTFFLAGHETTATAMSWLWYHLAKYPDVTERMRREIATVIPTAAETGTKLDQLHYCRRVLLESLRMYSPTWALSRAAREDDTIGNCHIRKGTNVLVYVPGIHRHPDYWDNPTCFDPDRFEREDIERSPAYLPFGVGPRMCIGRHFAETEMLVICSILLRRPTAAMRDGQAVIPKAEITLRPTGGLPMTLR
jgi:cytochrome P450